MAADALTDLREVQPIGGGDICAAYRAQRDGRNVFVKTLANAPDDFFTTEAAGLRWLAEAGAAVPDVVDVDERRLILDWVDPGRPTAAAADELGRMLAGVHAAGAPTFGADWPGFIGSLPLDNTRRADWPTFYGEQRLRPFLRRAADRGAVDAGGVRTIERLIDRLPDLAGPAEPPARIHGDLWSGNILWAADGTPRLIDPAAHGGHRETDLAMLDLFGAPHLARVLAAYQDVAPLADGWRERVPFHQLHPLLVHATLFGGSYGSRAVAAAERLVGRA